MFIIFKKPSNIVFLAGIALVFYSFSLIRLYSPHHIPTYPYMLRFLTAFVFFVLMPIFRTVMDSILFFRNYEYVVKEVRIWYYTSVPAMISGVTVFDILFDLYFDTAYVADLFGIIVKLAIAISISLCIAILARIVLPRIEYFIQLKKFDLVHRYLASLLAIASVLTCIWIVLVWS